MDKGFLKKSIGEHWLGLSVIYITVLAFILRIVCCFWGYPLILHPDEKAIVQGTIEMLSRHSWEAHIYDRPDHFEIKCNAVLFSIVSWVKYGKPAYEAFAEHEFAFHFIARLFTTVFGTFLVPLTSLFTGELIRKSDLRYKKIIQLISVILVAFSPIFVQHSAYATPDVVLTFFVILFSYLQLKYFETGDLKVLVASVVCIGVGVTIKYPALILCVVLACVVIWKEGFINKRPLNIIKYGFYSIFVLVACILVIAPNLFTDINMVIDNFLEEARPNHLGADNLGIVGNFRFYFDSVFESIGTVCLIPFVAGLVSLLVYRRKEYAFLGVGLVFWFCMSLVSLHWLRWGIPFYIFFYIVIAIGIVGLLNGIFCFSKQKKVVLTSLYSLVILFTTLILINTVISGLCITKYSLQKSTLVCAKEYLDCEGMNEENVLCEGYTSFDPSASKYVPVYLRFSINDDGSVSLNEEWKYKKYIMISDSYVSRYIREPERYVEQCTIYNSISNDYELLYSVIANGNYSPFSNVFKNIVYSFEYLASENDVVGSSIYIYRLNAE
ncbi:MAG: phospholipid carrier-dependent glycosyltransferase [Clostridia bacterium]|nr:phospholipid carrier-dependent glycosyltransferase [Clostridia bacterium]